MGNDDSLNTKSTDSLLYAAYRDCVNLLVTEDRKLLSKATRLGLADRVLTMTQALPALRRLLPNEEVGKPAALKDDFVYNLDTADPFFHSLKREYDEFPLWVKKVAADHRKCWVYERPEGGIGALLIRKIEEEAVELADSSLPKYRRLKLCTFKVGSTGLRIGELFVKLAVEYAVNNSISEIYLTHFLTEEKDELVDLICEYGFRGVGLNKGGETVFLKKLFPEKQGAAISIVDFHKLYWPCFYDGARARKFIVPIRPGYHDRLFVEIKKRVSLFEMAGQMIVEGNTIRKAYLCHSKSTSLVPGSILLFYRSQDEHAVTALGVVESVYPGVTNEEAVTRVIDRRTVYSRDQIADMMIKPTTVLLFTWHLYLARPVPLNLLQQKGILRGAPQSIIEISHGSYLKVKALGGVDERFAFDKIEVF